ncbi:ead/Ea22-like family protein [Escherichia coli]|nr:ead/Ea22-like family protein [Escherichia coli]
MSEINYQALREAAEKATKGQWAVEFDDEIYSTDGVNHEQIAMVFSENESRDAAFIAAANPATVLALLDELERNQQYIKRRDQENEDKLIPVMVMYEDGEMWSAMWNGNRWDDGTEYPDPHSVTHWREMPAAPQQEVK